MLEDFLGMLQDQGLSPNPIANYAKAIRTFYRIHRITIQLSYPLTRKVVYSDRAPTPEEIAKILEVANIREKVVISLLALGGFREGTLVRLKYKHLSQDLEKGITPVQVMVPAEITKGKYAEYWTFIGAEAVEYLKLYLEARREGLTNNHPPEKIGPETPIIKHTKSFEPKPITEKQLRVMVHNLLIKAGIINKNQKPLSQVRTHSFRKFFRTQLISRGVPVDYVEFWMGHKTSTYMDVKSKGVEFQRNLYAAANLSIKGSTKVNKIEILKTIIRSLGMNPEKVLVRESLIEPHRTLITQEDQIKILNKTLKELLRKELLEGEKV